MRSKLAVGGLAVVIGFLLATNPVLAEAAKQITGKQIKNNSVTSKDIKNNNLTGKDVKDGSLAAADLAAGTIPTVPKQIKVVKRMPNSGLAAPSGTYSFVSTPVTVSVDADDLVVVDSVLELDPAAAGDTIDLSTCFRVAGSAAIPSVLDPANLFDQNASHANEHAFPVLGSGKLAAGNYQVGSCTDVFSGAWTTHSVEGLVTVYDGASAGPFTRPGPSTPEPRD
jgi:hypothetical protein